MTLIFHIPWRGQKPSNFNTTQNTWVTFWGFWFSVVSVGALAYNALTSGLWSGHGSPTPQDQPHTRSLWHRQQEGKVEWPTSGECQSWERPWSGELARVHKRLIWLWRPQGMKEEKREMMALVSGNSILKQIPGLSRIAGIERGLLRQLQ